MRGTLLHFITRAAYNFIIIVGKSQEDQQPTLFICVLKRKRSNQTIFLSKLASVQETPKKW